MKEKVAGAFLSRFQLQPEGAKLLRGPRNIPVNEVYNYLMTTVIKYDINLNNCCS